MPASPYPEAVLHSLEARIGADVWGATWLRNWNALTSLTYRYYIYTFMCSIFVIILFSF